MVGVKGGDLSPLSLFSSVKALALFADVLSNDLAAVACLTQLTRLKVRSYSPWSVISQVSALPQLASFDITLQAGRQVQQLSLLHGLNLGALTHLGLKSAQGLGSEVGADLSAVLCRASGLVSLRLPLERTLGFGRLPHVFSALSRLTSLKVTFHFGMYLDLRPCFVTQLTRLSALDLSGFITRAHGLEALGRLSNLTRLCLCVSNLLTADDTRCLGRLSKLESLHVYMQFPREVRQIAPAQYPIALFEAAFGDLQGVRREMGWQDLKVWRWHSPGCSWVHLFWGLPGHDWDHVHGF
jgi:hypothetical protein